jgi:hypothetical protein
MRYAEFVEPFSKCRKVGRFRLLNLLSERSQFRLGVGSSLHLGRGALLRLRRRQWPQRCRQPHDVSAAVVHRRHEVPAVGGVDDAQHRAGKTPLVDSLRGGDGPKRNAAVAPAERDAVAGWAHRQRGNGREIAVKIEGRTPRIGFNILDTKHFAGEVHDLPAVGREGDRVKVVARRHRAEHRPRRDVPEPVGGIGRSGEREAVIRRDDDRIDAVGMSAELSQQPASGHFTE